LNNSPITLRQASASANKLILVFRNIAKMILVITK